MHRTVLRPRLMVTRQTRGTFPVIAALAMMATLALNGAPAVAQAVRPLEPRFVVVTSPDVPLKAGPASVHYAVVLLKAGQVLRADGETTDDPVFLRVEYPAGVPAFVKAEEATVEAQGTGSPDRLRLTAPSRLRAANRSGGERGHWWFLLPEDAPLAAGSTLDVIETLKADTRVYGYLAAAPREARGFVKSDAVRPATPAEIEEHQRALAGPAAEPVAVETPAPSVDSAEARAARREMAAAGVGDAQVGRQPEVQPVSNPAPEQPAAPAPMPTTPDSVAPAAVTPPAEEPVAQPETPAAAPANAPVEEPVAPPVATLESLASLFEQAQAQPIRDAELTEVMAEFQRAIDAQPETIEGQSTKAFLGARMQVLRLRADLQKSIRAAEELAGATSQRDERFAGEISAIDRSRSYVVVGRLMPSTVYDGKRLPRMFRVQSVDEGFSRTVAYLAPAAGDVQFDAMIGRVVGIVGDTQIDPALRVNIVRPRRVDVLSPAAAPAPAPAPAEGG